LASDWSFNVWKYGLTGMYNWGPLTKAARTLGNFWGGGIMTNLQNGVGQRAVIWLPGEAIPEYYQVLYYFVPTNRFPYQADVEPDLHT